MKYLIVFFLLAFTSISFSQRNVKDSSISTALVGLHYNGMWPGGDLAERYGFWNHVGISVGHKTVKNWYYGLDANFMFGNNLKVDSLFTHLEDEFGRVTDINGDIGVIMTYPRGLNVNLSGGRLFNVFAPNKNSGILVHAGMGFLVHRIRIETNDQVIPQVELDYRKGYDRLTSGMNFHQFVGYSFLANGGAWNFYGGFYAQQGLTRNRREVFFDRPNEVVSKDLRLEWQVGFRLGWYIPFYKRLPKDFYYN